MSGTIEVVGFMDLTRLFRERGWASPHLVSLDAPISGAELLRLLDVDRQAVESLMLNHRATPVEGTTISPGDRVALVPPGVPGPHRYCLGIYRRS